MTGGIPGSADIATAVVGEAPVPDRPGDTVVAGPMGAGVLVVGVAEDGLRVVGVAEDGLPVVELAAAGALAVAGGATVGGEAVQATTDSPAAASVATRRRPVRWNLVRRKVRRDMAVTHRSDGVSIRRRSCQGPGLTDTGPGHSAVCRLRGGRAVCTLVPEATNS
jgi:hypothetical protein